MDLNSLPAEMLLHMFSYLDPIDLCQLTGPVCERWQRLSYDPSLWMNVILDEPIQTPNEIARIVQNSRLAHSLLLSRISDWTFTISLPKNNNLRTIKFNGCNLTEYRSSQLVNSFPSVECVLVIFDHFDLRFIREIAQWQFLKEITLVHNDDEDFFNGNECLGLLMDKCQNLETIRLPLTMELDDKPLVDFMKFHGPNLKKLTAFFGHLSSDGFGFLAQCTNLTDLNLCDTYRMTRFGLRNLKQMKFLEKLRIGMAILLITQDYVSLFENHVFICLLDLTIDGCEGVNDLVIECISKSCPNVKKLELRDCDNVSDSGIKHVVTGSRDIESLTLNMLPVITGTCFAEISDEMLKLNHLQVDHCWKFNEKIFVDLKSKRPNLYIDGFEISFGDWQDLQYS